MITNALADTLGNQLAKKADLSAEIDVTKADIIGLVVAGNDRVVEGELFRATVSFANKTVVDYKAVLDSLVLANRISREELNDLIRVSTRTAEGVPTVRCAARK